MPTLQVLLGVLSADKIVTMSLPVILIPVWIVLCGFLGLWFVGMYAAIDSVDGKCDLLLACLGVSGTGCPAGIFFVVAGIKGAGIISVGWSVVFIPLWVWMCCFVPSVWCVSRSDM